MKKGKAVVRNISYLHTSKKIYADLVFPWNKDAIFQENDEVVIILKSDFEKLTAPMNPGWEAM